MKNTKDEVQRNGLNKWVKAGRIGLLEYATGVGKTRCGVLAAAYYARAANYDFKILILTPTVTIRDTAWLNEFRKWKAYDVWKKCITIECIQTAYKFKGKHWDLVIADEIHNYLGPEYIGFFSNNTYDALLGLSATINESERFLMDEICPTVDKITTKDAVELGLVSPFSIFNLGVILTKTEQSQYNYINGRIQLAADRYGKAPKKLLSERAQILYNAEYKIEVATKLVKEAEDRYGVIFANSISFIQKLQKKLGDKAVMYHSKMTPKQRKDALKAFNDGRTKVRIILAARALDEGANLSRVSYAIIAAGYSGERQTIQRLGRIIRWEEGKEAILIRLYSKGTRDEAWVKKSQENYDSNYISSLKEIKWPIIECQT